MEIPNTIHTKRQNKSEIMLDTTGIGLIFTAPNILGMGMQLIWFGFSAALALAFATNKKEFMIGWTFVYTIMFLIGAATEAWLLILLALAAAIYYTRTRDG